MTMKVKEEIFYKVAEFKCPVCKENHTVICKPKKENPKYKSNRHGVI